MFHAKAEFFLSLNFWPIITQIFLKLLFLITLTQGEKSYFTFRFYEK